MSAITWDEIGDRTFEIGLDRGVLYFPDGGGVAWNGLLGVDHRVAPEVDPVYYDGVKFNDIVTPGDFNAVLKAYTYPEEFLQFEGLIEEQTGFYVDQQQPALFHLSYRTKTGNDIQGVDQGYKIHLLWNLTAIPATKSYQTLSLDVEPMEFEWDLSSIPEEIDRHRPTSHVVIDSRKIDPLLLADIEDILYGTVDNEPTMPTLKSLSSFIRKWNRTIVIDNLDGTWTLTAVEEDVITMTSPTEFEITYDEAVFVDADSYTLTSSDKNEEDIF